MQVSRNQQRRFTPIAPSVPTGASFRLSSEASTPGDPSNPSGEPVLARILRMTVPSERRIQMKIGALTEANSAPCMRVYQ